MVTKVVGPIAIAIHRPMEPSDADWGEYMEAITGVVEEYGYVRTLVLTEGSGGPNAARRRELAAFGATNDHRLAIVTASAATRGIATALNWLGTPLKAFSPSEQAEAFEYIDITPEVATEFEAIIAEAKRDLA